MNMMQIGSITNSLKTMKLKMDFNEQKKKSFIKVTVEEDPRIAEFKRAMAESKRAGEIASIDAKMSSGQELTDAELEYLKKESPELYKKALEIQKERKAYEEQLKRCRTKEEVNQLNNSKIQASLSQAKAVATNANISKAEKLSQLKQINAVLMNIQNVYLRFIATPEFKKLPRDEEERKNSSSKKITTYSNETQGLEFKKAFKELINIADDEQIDIKVGSKNTNLPKIEAKTYTQGGKEKIDTAQKSIISQKV